MENSDSVAKRQLNSIGAILRTINLSTFVGIGLLLSFLILSLFNTTAVRWWLMIPIIVVAGICMEIGRQRFVGLEKKICMVGLIVAVSLGLIRDALISYKMAIVYDTVMQTQKVFTDAFQNTQEEEDEWWLDD